MPSSAFSRLFARLCVLASRKDRRRAARLGMETLEARDVPAVTFTVEALSNTTEGGAAGTFRVTATGDPSDFTPYSVVAIWSGTGGTATYNTDYTGNPALAGYLYFPSSGSQATVTITPVDDSTVEGDETLELRVQRYQMFPFGPVGVGTMTIHDNDTPPPTGAIAGTVWDDGDGDQTQDTGEAGVGGVVVEFLNGAGAVVGQGVAGGGGAFNLGGLPVGPGTLRLVFPPALRYSFDYPAAGTRERSLPVTVTAGGTATVNSPSHPDPTVSVAAVSGAVEGGAPGVLRFTRSGWSGHGLTATYSVGGSPTPGSEYGALPGTVTFAAGQASVDVLVEAYFDGTAESPEGVTVAVNESPVYVAGTTPATVTVEDAEVAVSVAWAADAVEGGAVGKLVLTRTGDPTHALTVNYTVDTTGLSPATPGSDYAALSGTATFAAGSTTTDVTVTPYTDGLVEVTESVAITLLDSEDYEIGTETAGISIIDMTPLVWAERVNNAAEGSTPGLFRFTRTGDPANALTVTYTVQTVGPGLATPGTDYATLSGTISFLAGDATVDVSVVAYQDGTTELPESVDLTVIGGSTYAAAPGSAQLWIWDNTLPFVPQVTVAGIADAVEGGALGYFRFTRTGDTSDELVATYTLVTGTDQATPGDDYTILSGSLTFPTGKDTVDIVVTAVDDGQDEGTEFVTAVVLVGPDYEPGQPATGVVRIADTDTESGTIGGFVWDDTDGDGIQDTNEFGRDKYLVTLLDGSGDPQFTIVTDENGAYAFDGLDEGVYSVRFERPEFEILTLRDQGEDDEHDSDADPLTGLTSPIPLIPTAMSHLFASVGLAALQAGPRIIIAKANGVETRTLKVGKMQDAFHYRLDGSTEFKGPMPGNLDFIDRDPDHFVVWVYDPERYAAADKLPSGEARHTTVRIKTENVEGFTAYNDGWKSIDLIRYLGDAKGKGWYWTDTQLLASSDIDDRYENDTYLRSDNKGPVPAPEGKLGSGQPKRSHVWNISDRTHRIALNGTVHADYTPMQGAAVATSAEVPVVKKVSIHATVVRDSVNGTVSLTAAEVRSKIHDANEYFAQVGILLEVRGDVDIVNPHPTVNPINLTIGGKVDRGIYTPTRDEAAIIESNRTGAVDDIELYIVRGFNRTDGTEGIAFPQQYVRTPTQHDSTIIVSNASVVTYAHEIGHILTNYTHYDDARFDPGAIVPVNLMANEKKFVLSKPTLSTDSRRLTESQEFDILRQRRNLLADPDN